jgi:hypothetical protein
MTRTEAAKRRCFVISPIGPEGSEVRQHADDVFEFIVEPSMSECGIEARRSDHFREPGTISQQMIEAILTHDLCVAILSGRNANVFYELAIAQCAGRPVIVLLKKGEELPFDVKDLRVVFYDLNHRSLKAGTYKKEIVDHVKALSQPGWKAPRLFENIGPLNGDSVGLAEELHRGFPFRERSIGSTQENLLSIIVKRAKRGESIEQTEVQEALGRGSTETYYRLEQLRLLGFIAKEPIEGKSTHRYRLTADYRRHLELPPEST